MILGYSGVGGDLQGVKSMQQVFSHPLSVLAVTYQRSYSKLSSCHHSLQAQGTLLSSCFFRQNYIRQNLKKRESTMSILTEKIGYIK